MAVESDAVSAAAARANLAALGISNTRIIEAPIEGGASHGPFDVILLEGAVDHVADALLAQLADGGRLVALIRQGLQPPRTSTSNPLNRDVASRIEFTTTLPPLPGGEAPAEFVF